MEIRRRAWAAGMKLDHENLDHVLLGINRETRIEESSPIILPWTAKLVQGNLDAVYAETETKRLIGELRAKLVMRHQLNGGSADLRHDLRQRIMQALL